MTTEPDRFIGAYDAARGVTTPAGGRCVGPDPEWDDGLKRAWNDSERSVGDLMGGGYDLDVEDVHRAVEKARLERDRR